MICDSNHDPSESYRACFPVSFCLWCHGCKCWFFAQTDELTPERARGTATAFIAGILPVTNIDLSIYNVRIPNRKRK